MAEPLERSLASAAGDKASGVGAPARTSWMRWAWVAGLSTAGSAIALIGAGYSLSGLLIRPRLKRLSQLKSPHLKHFFQRIGYPVEDVTFHSFDATRLSGWWLPVSSSVSSEASVSDSATVPSVVVLHGVKKNRSDVIRTGLVLRRAGFNVLMLDGRAHGNSGGRYVTYGYYECRDVEAALDWLVNEKKVARDLVGLAGESMGAAIALQAAAANPWLGAVWADSPFASLRRIAGEFVENATHLPPSLLSPVLWTALRVANYRGNFDVETVDPLAMAGKIKCPVFIAHGTADQLISPEHSRDIVNALTCKKELWLIEGARHARAARYVRSEYAARITGFFKQNLVHSQIEAA